MSCIPKIIHFIWVGGNIKPEVVNKCIKSWKKYMPDYDIMEWNEHNYDVNKSKYMREAFAEKKWAFVSDYMRFDILNQYGGIYFDTDVELLKPIPENILNKSLGFTGMESTGRIAPGLIFAIIPKHPFLYKILESYEKDSFIINGNYNLKTVNMRTTEILEAYGFIANNCLQEIERLVIYPSSFFCGYDLDIRELSIERDTISVHHYTGTWKNKGLKRKVQNAIKKIIGNNNYRKLLKLKRNLFGTYNK